METGTKVSQAYIIGARNPGETVLPVRAVLASDGTVTLRCVALRTGAIPCAWEWPLIVADAVGTDISDIEREVAHMMDHMTRYHSPYRGNHSG